MSGDEQDRAARAEEALSRRDELYALVIHDLRNPLNTIGMSCALLSDDLEGPQKETVARIKRSVDRMEKLMRDVSDLIRLEHGDVRLDPLPLRAGDLLRQGLETHIAKAAAKKVTVDIAAVDDELRAVVDRERFIQALSSVIDNAVKFTPEGGRVDLSAKATGDFVEFVIADTGPGIAAEDQPTIFERHRKINKKRGQGLVLGLAIVALVVQQLGGTIALDSPSTGGAKIMLRMKREA